MEDKERELLQKLSERLCGRFDKKEEFEKRLVELCEEFPLNYKVNYIFNNGEQTEE